MNKVVVVGVCRRAVEAGDLLSAPVTMPNICVASRVTQTDEAMDEIVAFGVGAKDGDVRQVPGKKFHLLHMSNTASSLSARILYDVVTLSTAEQLAMLSSCKSRC